MLKEYGNPNVSCAHYLLTVYKDHQKSELFHLIQMFILSVICMKLSPRRPYNCRYLNLLILRVNTLNFHGYEI